MTRLLGRLRPCAIPNALTGELRCKVFGTTFSIVATKDGDGYVLEATTGPIPEGIRIPLLDDEP